MALSPVAFPLGAPVVSNSQITVDIAYKQPGKITKRLSDLTQLVRAASDPAL